MLFKKDLHPDNLKTRESRKAVRVFGWQKKLFISWTVFQQKASAGGGAGQNLLKSRNEAKQRRKNFSFAVLSIIMKAKVGMKGAMAVKKLSVLVTALVVCLLMAGCGRSDVGQNFAKAVEGWSPTASGEKGVDVVYHETPSFADTLGFELSSYPNDAALMPYKFFSINKKYAQVEFKNPEDVNLVLRVAKAGGAPLARTYDEAHTASDEVREVAGVELRTRTTKDGKMMMTWARGDFEYLLHTNRTPPTDTEVARMVGELQAQATE